MDVLGRSRNVVLGCIMLYASAQLHVLFWESGFLGTLCENLRSHVSFGFNRYVDRRLSLACLPRAYILHCL